MPSVNPLFQFLREHSLSPRETLFFLYTIKPKYKTFQIPKKSGGFRDISAPYPKCKAIQRALLPYLKSIYTPRPCVYAFCDGKNIKKNALPHVGKRHVINVDLKDFYKSITFKRIRSILASKYYNIPHNIATVIAHTACYQGSLPQGGVLSPILSNIVAGVLGKH